MPIDERPASGVPIPPPTEDELAAWEAAISSSLFVCDVDFEEVAAGALSVTTQTFADIEFIEVVSGPHVSRRDGRLVNSADKSEFLMVLQLQGQFRVTQDGRTAVLDPGDLCFIESSHPVEVHTSGNYRGIGVKFPLRLLGYPRENLSRLTARAVRADQGVAATVSAILLTLNTTIGSIDASSQYKMIGAVVELVEAMLASIDPQSQQPDVGGEVRMEQVKDYIEAHLGDQDLAPGRVAAALYISVRQLHYLFRETGTSMSTWVRERRLSRCQADLADPTLKHLPISAIASKWGFNSSSHFGQVFKASARMTPRQFRDHHLGRPAEEPSGNGTPGS